MTAELPKIYNAKRIKVFQVKLCTKDDSCATVRYYGSPYIAIETEWYVEKQDAKNAVKKFIASLSPRDCDWYSTDITEKEILEIQLDGGKVEYRQIYNLVPSKLILLEGNYYNYRDFFAEVDFSKSSPDSSTETVFGSWHKTSSEKKIERVDEEDSNNDDSDDG